MIRALYILAIISSVSIALAACGTGDDVVTPPPDNPDMRISVSRMNPSQTAIETLRVTVTRTENGTLALPGRTIVLVVTSGDIGNPTDRGDGTYEAVWTGDPEGEVTVIARDIDSDPPIETGLTFIALEFLHADWDVPVKLAYPISTNGWDTAPCLYPDGSRLAFSYITIDMLALAAGFTRPIGEERPGHSSPRTLDIYIASRPDTQSWWSGWTVDHAQTNLYQALPMHISAPSVSGDGLVAFCTVQEFEGDVFGPSAIYIVDPEFEQAPSPLGPPVDMVDFGEDNPYYDSTHGWLYFDTYSLDDPLSKQDIWVTRAFGSGQFDEPARIGGGLNTVDVETQAFVHEPASILYFASDRGQDEYQLGIWRAPLYGDYAGEPELVARGMLAIARPSLTLDGEWFCFAYAREESHGSGANADIAMAQRLE